MKFAKVYPLDATFDKLEDVPADIRENKRYKDVPGYTISEVAEAIKKDFGHIDFLVHSLANGPEVKKPFLKRAATATLPRSAPLLIHLSVFWPILARS